MSHYAGRIQPESSIYWDRYAAKSCKAPGKSWTEPFAAVGDPSAPKNAACFLCKARKYQRPGTEETLPEVDYEQVYRNILQHTCPPEENIYLRKSGRRRRVHRTGRLRYYLANAAKKHGPSPGWHNNQRRYTTRRHQSHAHAGRRNYRYPGQLGPPGDQRRQYHHHPAAGPVALRDAEQNLRRRSIQHASARGGQFCAVLPDGSKVWLNSHRLSVIPCLYRQGAHGGAGRAGIF